MRHWYLTPDGRLVRRRKTDWRYVAKICGAIVVGLLAGLGLADLVFIAIGRAS